MMSWLLACRSWSRRCSASGERARARVCVSCGVVCGAWDGPASLVERSGEVVGSCLVALGDLAGGLALDRGDPEFFNDGVALEKDLSDDVGEEHSDFSDD